MGVFTLFFYTSIYYLGNKSAIFVEKERKLFILGTGQSIKCILIIKTMKYKCKSTMTDPQPC